MSDIVWTLAGLAVIAGTWLWGTAADRRAVRRDAAVLDEAADRLESSAAALTAILDPEAVEAIARAFDQHTVQDGPNDQDECCCGWRKAVDCDEWPFASDRHLAEVAHAAIVARIDAALGTVTP